MLWVTVLTWAILYVAFRVIVILLRWAHHIKYLLRINSIAWLFIVPRLCQFYSTFGAMNMGNAISWKYVHCP